MRTNTWVFPIDRPLGRVLLGYKKHGFGVGKFGGFGGKVEAGETIAAVARRLLEESGLRAKEHNLWYAAHLSFEFPAKPEWDNLVHVFRLEFWEGEPQETQEMRPKWFGFEELPFDLMWADAPHWLVKVLAGEKLQMRFAFEDDNESLLLVEQGGPAQGFIPI